MIYTPLRKMELHIATSGNFNMAMHFCHMVLCIAEFCSRFKQQQQVLQHWKISTRLQKHNISLHWSAMPSTTPAGGTLLQESFIS